MTCPTKSLIKASHKYTCILTQLIRQRSKSIFYLRR